MTVTIEKTLTASMPVNGKRQHFTAKTLFRLDLKVMRFFKLVERQKRNAAMARISREMGSLRKGYKRARTAFISGQAAPAKQEAVQ